MNLLLEQEGCCGVAQVMKADVWQSSLCSQWMEIAPPQIRWIQWLSNLVRKDKVEIEPGTTCG
jgi:hypothetical protein